MRISWDPSRNFSSPGAASAAEIWCRQWRKKHNQSNKSVIKAGGWLGGSQPSAATAWKKWGKTQDKSQNLASASHWAIIPLAHGFSISYMSISISYIVPNILSWYLTCYHGRYGESHRITIFNEQWIGKSTINWPLSSSQTVQQKHPVPFGAGPILGLGEHAGAERRLRLRHHRRAHVGPLAARLLRFFSRDFWWAFDWPLTDSWVALIFFDDIWFFFVQWFWWYLNDIWMIFEWYLNDIWMIFEWYLNVYVIKLVGFFFVWILSEILNGFDDFSVFWWVDVGCKHHQTSFFEITEIREGNFYDLDVLCVHFFWSWESSIPGISMYIIGIIGL